MFKYCNLELSSTKIIVMKKKTEKFPQKIFQKGNDIEKQDFR